MLMSFLWSVRVRTVESRYRSVETSLRDRCQDKLIIIIIMIIIIIIIIIIFELLFLNSFYFFYQLFDPFYNCY